MGRERSQKIEAVDWMSPTLRESGRVGGERKGDDGPVDEG